MTDEPQATAAPVHLDDLVATDDAPTAPEPDLEATLLCAVPHTTNTIKAPHIKAEDLLKSSYGELCAVVADFAPRAAHTTPGQVVALFGTPAVRVRALSADVLNSVYRRQFAQTAAGLTRASTEAPTDALFEILLEQGRAIRRETKCRAALAAGPTRGAGEQE